MNEKIHLLPESIANQIAAGEVIQRPASILKELVENAIDAGATIIRVEILDAGKSLIRVSDNGCGMSPMDARMAFERHATSKISSVEDLFALTSMGFRGEALASIASVAQVELITRREEDEIGTMLTINGSEVTSVKNIAAPIGSTFTIRNIFFNVPARRRFLKTNTTEIRHLQEQYEKIVLVYPDIAFSFISEGKSIFELSKNTLLRRISNTLGIALEKSLIPIKFENEVIKISGFIGSPESAKKRNYEQFFFVNGRFMKHPYFHRSVISVYENLLPPSYQPNYFIYFTINPAQIDVNIHPTKTEIKFIEEQTIYHLLSIVVRQKISLNMSTPDIDFFKENIVEIPNYKGKSNDFSFPDVVLDKNFNPFTENEPPTSFSIQPEKNVQKIDWGHFLKEKTQELKRANNKVKNNFTESHFCELITASSSEEKLKPSSSKCLIFLQKYIITYLSSSIVFIDSHRAKSRIAYQEVVKSLQEKTDNICSISLLNPEICTFPPREEERISTILKEFENLGFEISPLGGGKFSILQIPIIIEENAKEIIEKSITNILEHENINKDILIDIIASFYAQQKGMTFSPLLSIEEANEITASLFACNDCSYTPTGKKIIQTLSSEDIINLFK